MATSFKDARAENFESGYVFGNIAHFGESVSYRPAEGGGARTVDVTITEDEQEEIPVAEGEQRQERIWVRACKSTMCTRGGIDRPAIGDVIVRAGEADQPPWSYQGQIRNETSHGWDLLYARNRRTRYGQPTAV